MHQSRMIAAPLEHFGHDLFLADIALVDMLDLDASGLAVSGK